MKLGFTALALAALLSSSPFLTPAALTEEQPPAIPDAPTPQAPKPLSSETTGPITPGKGAGVTPSGPNSSSTPPAEQPVPSSLPPTNQIKDLIQTTPPEMPAPGQGASAITTLVRHTTFVEVPVTVKDSKGKLVAGLTYRDFKVFENDTRAPLAFFTVDAVSAFDRLCHRPEPDLRCHGQGQQLPRRHPGRAHAL